MPRRPDLDRPVPLKLMLPESERTRLDLHLFSALEGRVPQGAYQNFFRERIREFFTDEGKLATLYSDIYRWWRVRNIESQEEPSFVKEAKDFLASKGVL